VRQEVVEVHREVGEVVEEEELEQQKDEQWTGVTKNNQITTFLFTFLVWPSRPRPSATPASPSGSHTHPRLAPTPPAVVAPDPGHRHPRRPLPTDAIAHG
jgi:hypothetical protein